MSKFLKVFVRDERGVSAMEYAILAGIVVVALGLVGTALNTSLVSVFNNLTDKVKAAAGT